VPCRPTNRIPLVNGGAFAGILCAVDSQDSRGFATSILGQNVCIGRTLALRRRI
jgi:hypothetical protein